MPANDSLIILGPTASGKTALAIALARILDGEIISADSRQVYRGLDIGTGKDLHEYEIGGPPVRHHLIDIVDPRDEYSVFQFQRDFFAAVAEVQSRGKFPITAGGTGLYLEAALSPAMMVPVPYNAELRAAMEPMSTEVLAERLVALRPDTHNTTDLLDRDRVLRAIEIAVHTDNSTPEPAPPLNPLVLGVAWDRKVLRQRIARRLNIRLDEGLIEEVEDLMASGVPWERLEQLGLEYRYVSRYVRGAIKNRNDLYQKLSGEISRFAKRQDTWFRRMERQGVPIQWIPEGRLEEALAAIRAAQ
ncbi:MAG: tRNA (adenosine(37)-N6)-dimethylallyltransferase MiaA [Candidatus Hydrogenedentes bacterium]|nr:tRNA (adenosine(37)-N6)-dimethylallyltransferase MiaA [Candidatus Hydrogenedentota bacterium]